MNQKTVADGLCGGRSWLFGLLFCIAAGANSTAWAGQEPEGRLRTLVENYFDCYQNRDLNCAMSFWSERAPNVVEIRRRLQQTFGTAGKLAVTKLSVDKVTVEDNKAAVHFIVDLNATDRTGRPVPGPGPIGRTLRFVREAGEWKLWQNVADDDEVAARLVRVEAESERNLLLTSHKDKLTLSLLQAVIEQVRALISQSRYAQALAAGRFSLEFAEQLGNKAALSRSLTNLGIILAAQGDYSEALSHYQESLKLVEGLDDQIQIAYLLNNIGIVYDSQGNYERALEYYQKSLRLKEQLGDKAGISRTFNNIAVVHRLRGDLAQALEYFRKALTAVEDLGETVLVARTLTNIGVVLTRQGKYTEALDTLEKSLKLSESLQSEYVQALALGNLGILFGLRGDHAKSIEYFNRNLALNRAMGNKEGIATCLNNLGESEFAQGHYVQAAELFGQAAALGKQIESAEIIVAANTMAGRAYHAIGQPARARQSYLTAIDAIEDLRGQVGGGEQEQQRSFENRLSAYYGMVDLLAEQNNASEALLYAERAKGRVLLDVLQGGRVDLTTAMTSEERRQERDLRAATAAINSQLRMQRMQQAADENRGRDLEARLEKSRLEYEAFQTTLYAAHPELKIHRGQMKPVTTSEISQLMPAGTALLEFAVLEDKTFLFVLTREAGAGPTKVDLTLQALPIKQKQLRDIAERFSEAMAERRLSVQKLANQLFDLLLKPVQARLKGISALIIVPDDVLWQLPFQALQRPSDNRYLIEDHTISYAPSLTVLREMIRRQSIQASETTARPALLGFGNAAGGADTVARPGATSADALEPLPEAEKQVQLLGQLYGRDQSRIYIGPRAQEGRFKAEAGNYRILHLASHGVLNDASPMYSQLVLSPSQTADGEDGLLEAWEIMKLNLRAELVVLSACETARGRASGEGIIGLSWALFVAGVPTAVLSQWELDSASSTECMLEFHRQIKNDLRSSRPVRSAAALRQSALRLLKGRKYNHPFYWAAFVIVGNGMGTEVPR